MKPHPTDPMTNAVIAAAIEVHRALGPGLLEAAYQLCLAEELRFRRIPFEREKPMRLAYRDLALEGAYRLDFLVDRSVVVEVKAVEALSPVHRAQLLTYLRIGRYPAGLLLNFGGVRLADGLRRLLLDDDPPPS